VAGCWKELKRSQKPADCNHTNKGAYKTTQRLHPNLFMEFYCSPLIAMAFAPTLAVLTSQMAEVPRAEVPQMALKASVEFVSQVADVPQIAELRLTRTSVARNTLLFMLAEIIVFIYRTTLTLSLACPLAGVSLFLSFKSYGAGFRGFCSRSPNHISAPDYV
jgi:hypothetical protein